MRASFNGSGYPATNRETWRFKSSRPRHFPARRPRDRAQPSEGWNSGSTPDGPANFLRSVGRLARYPAVYRVEASSILVRSAKVRGDVDKLAKSPVFQAGHRGFESRHRYHWPEAHQDEQAILNRQAASSILARPTIFCRVAELVQRSTVNREDVGSTPTPTAKIGP